MTEDTKFGKAELVPNLALPNSGRKPKAARVLNARLGQGGPEFNVVIAMVMLVFLVVLILVFQKQDESSKLQTFLDAERVTQSVADNINMISRNGNGYYRYFSVPSYLRGYTNYDLKVYGNILWMNYTGETWSTVLLTSNVTIAGLVKGDDKQSCVSNKGGQIYINGTCIL